ncbi:dihydroxyacetone kinase transcriptional activator DhaS [Vagococcus sp. BWB3-3]|uniref:Dihydroxyacetone kinase transcriptional activator DhaS n=1 Tax=Vagococcus allomyrinae TaxID=2794353 RepID=A0A940SUW9_9ENTE|nr:dihydroxyacetone kinase transcriptional activator DhaS [Vagococcus allomyrinae]MBP1039763.1 dihydroxyacetone kinase transcriptional activator DhaS [Vagococcus allomyrinae]
MQESLITKKVIAYSLKKLMEDVPFQKITIRQIMEQAEIRRQTFYDHFQDKYELLAWIYRQDISENISDFLDYEEWHKVIFRILDYFYHQQVFYCNALQVSEQNSFDHYFLEHTQGLLKTIIKDVAVKQTFPVPVKNLDFSAELLSHAFVGVTKEWLMNGCQQPVKDLAKDTAQVLEKAISGIITTT